MEPETQNANFLSVDLEKIAMSEEKNLLKRGRFYFIYGEDPQNFVVEDKTKRGLPVLESNIEMRELKQIREDFMMPMVEDMSYQ